MNAVPLHAMELIHGLKIVISFVALLFVVASFAYRMVRKQKKNPLGQMLALCIWPS